jgi:thioredoxin reductase (NADPH)
MADVLIIGDGPGGLSAALFLAKNDMDVTVFGQNKTFMHDAMLYNYLGIPEVTGTEFQEISRRQVDGFGSKILDVEVTEVETGGAEFAVSTAAGDKHQGKYLIVATGFEEALVEKLGLGTDSDNDDAIIADREGKTAVENLYVIGWLTRGQRTQAIISAGEGAATALSILSTEAGRDIHDFDVVKEDGDDE